MNCITCNLKLIRQQTKFCSRKCYGVFNKNNNIKPPSRKGYKFTDEEIQKKKEVMSKIIPSMKNPETVRKVQATKKATYDLRGRKSKIRNLIDKTKKYKEWRTKVFTRDNYKCILCNKKGSLEADHIKPLSFIIKENNIKSYKDSLKVVELWDINNGRTLCISCHKETETHGVKCVRLLNGEKVENVI